MKEAYPYGDLILPSTSSSIEICQASINSETTLLTPINEISLKIGYGTINNYRIYEVEELNHAFRFVSFDEPTESISSQANESQIPVGPLEDNIINQIIPLFDWQEPNRSYYQPPVNKPNQSNRLILPIFSRPEDPEDEFSQDELKELYSIMNDCISGLTPLICPPLTGLSEETPQITIGNFLTHEKENINDILSKIMIGSEINQEFEAMDDHKINQLRKLSLSEKKSVKTWFLLLFEIGMYMRRWKGSGYSYPILQGETLLKAAEADETAKATNNEFENEVLPGSNDPIHEQKTIRSILALKELETNMSSESICLLESLIGYNLIQGKIYKDKDGFNLRTRIETVLTKGGQTTDACIRLSSTIFIGTAYIYLYKIFNYVIPEFNPNLIEQVT